ncbi:MAG: molybdate ABC transporter substrate-binding protein [Burkholderiales bacterium]
MIKIFVTLRHLVALCGGLCLCTGACAQPVTLFAAASLTEALNAVVASYAQLKRDPVRVSFAGSATLARQIESGAGADIFFSADEIWMDYLRQRKLIDPATRVPRLGNRLVLVAPAGAPRQIELRKGFDLVALLGIGRLSIGHPDYVPAGQYAKQALMWLGVWEVASSRLALAENVRLALAYVERGEAPLGIVYATDVSAAPRVRQVAAFPSQSHAQIIYSLAVIAGRGRPQVMSFHAYLANADAGAIFARHGFQVK